MLFWGKTTIMMAAFHDDKDRNDKMKKNKQDDEDNKNAKRIKLNHDNKQKKHSGGNICPFISRQQHQNISSLTENNNR